MVDFEDGIKVSDAYVNADGTVTDAVWSGNTPVSAYNLNLAQKKNTGQVTIASGTTISNGYTVTLPVKYQVGNNSLELYLSGEKLIKQEGTADGHYTEVRH